MATIRITDDQHARELAISAKEHDKLERENKRMKMLMEIAPPHEVMERYASEEWAKGYIETPLHQYLIIIWFDESVEISPISMRAQIEGKFSGTYPEAQAFLASRLGAKE